MQLFFRRTPVAANVGGSFVLDPSCQEELQTDRYLFVVAQGPQSKIVHMDVHGMFSAVDVKHALELSLSACQFYYKHAHSALTSHITDNMQALNDAVH